MIEYPETPFDGGHRTWFEVDLGGDVALVTVEMKNATSWIENTSSSTVIPVTGQTAITSSASAPHRTVLRLTSPRKVHHENTQG